MEYKFYYDESEHSRKINYNTITAANYYDNFITVIVGWHSEYENEIAKKYKSFEEKYIDRASHGELKSKTIKQSQLQYGFASLNEENINLLEDFFSIFNENTLLYFSITSKIEFIIKQLFENYHNNIFEDMDSMKYSIVKALLTYHPNEIIECIYNNIDDLINLLKSFFQEKIEQNKINLTLKHKENQAFKEILLLLKDVQPIKTINWNYDWAFIGFNKYLSNKNIKQYSIIIDKEGNNQNTVKAAQRVGLNNIEEKNSTDYFGIRMSDMLAGIISKLLKAIHNCFYQNSLKGQIVKNLLDTQWFKVNNRQLNLYKKLHHIISELNYDYYKLYTGIYADDLISFVALLKYMAQFESIDKINNIDMQNEYFNSYNCNCLEDYFKQMKNKLPIEAIPNDSKDYFLNNKGAKVFFDINRQPMLKFTNGNCKHKVLSVGFNKKNVPLVTVAESTEAKCYRLPDDLYEWAMTIVSFANLGTNPFPSEVIFSEYKGKHYADIL